MFRLAIKPEADTNRSQMKIRVNPLTQRPSTSNILNQRQTDSLNNNNNNNNSNTNNSNAQQRLNPMATSTPKPTNSNLSQDQQQQQHRLQSQQQQSLLLPKPINQTVPTQQTQPNRQPQRRRVRRKGNTQPDDQAEHLTEMSVRGLDLFRYAKIYDGIYQCTECAKENVQKTFKNKYSFQRHAFLYHEGTSRKVFPCPVCQKEFSRPDKMKNHMKTTHECYMPKDTVYPLNFIAGGGGDAAAINNPTQKQQKQNKTSAAALAAAAATAAALAQATQNAHMEIDATNDTHAKNEHLNDIKIDTVMSQYEPHLATTIKIENVEIN